MKAFRDIDFSYVLITAARNEEQYIENTIKAVVAQTVLPVKWIIVSDGSTDRTDEIILQYAKQYKFISLAVKTATGDGAVDFTSKVHAIKMGYEKLQGVEYGFIGILDGDVSFYPYYYENILNRFAVNPKLGIAGGIIFDQYGNHCTRRSPNRSDFVCGCVQLFRRECYEDVGGLHPIREGGEDTLAAVGAQMKGWVVEAFEEIQVYHLKHSQTIGGKCKEAFRFGRTSYALGYHPLFQLLKSIKSVTARPYLLSSIARMCGCFLPYLQKQERPVTERFVQFLRKRQLEQLKKILSRQRGDHE